MAYALSFLVGLALGSFLNVVITRLPLAAPLWWRFPASPLLLAYGPFCGALLALSAIDLEHRLLPDAITLPGTALGLALALVLPHLTFLEAAAGAAAGGALVYGVGWGFSRLPGTEG